MFTFFRFVGESKFPSSNYKHTQFTWQHRYFVMIDNVCLYLPRFSLSVVMPTLGDLLLSTGVIVVVELHVLLITNSISAGELSALMEDT